MPIRNAEDLRRHPVLAARVEATTIPPHLYALYSIEDSYSDASVLIRSVVVEEMLHLALVTNILLAVGGEPDFASRELIPSYPCLLPHHVPDLPVHLASASVELVRDVLFGHRECEAPLTLPEDDEYESIGQFYLALEEAIVGLGSEAASSLIISRDGSYRTPRSTPRWPETRRTAVAGSCRGRCERIGGHRDHRSPRRGARWRAMGRPRPPRAHPLLQVPSDCRGSGYARPGASGYHGPTARTPPRRARASGSIVRRPLPIPIVDDGRALRRGGGPGLPDGPSLSADDRRAVVPGALPHGAPARRGFVAGPGFENHDFGGEDPAAHLIALAQSVSEDHPALDGFAELVAAG